MLDVGCGIGRLLLDYVHEGIAVEGVDNSPEMLALCSAKAVDLGLQPALYEGWMETLGLPRRYRTIIVPSSTFQLLSNQSAAETVMGRLYHHLEARGGLVISFQTFWKPGSSNCGLGPDWRGGPANGWRMRFDPESQMDTLEEERFEVIVVQPQFVVDNTVNAER